VRNLRLPIGKQVLHIKNPPSGKQWDATCEVVEGQTKLCQTQMP